MLLIAYYKSELVKYKTFTHKDKQYCLLIAYLNIELFQSVEQEAKHDNVSRTV